MTVLRLTRFPVTAVLLITLAACSNSPQGIRVINGGTSAIPAKQAAPIRDLGMQEIGPSVLGKTFQYTRKGSSGFVVYNADGTLTIQDDQRGQMVGRWTTNTGQYCETYGPGAPPECGPFKNTGDALIAASTHLVEMKV